MSRMAETANRRPVAAREVSAILLAAGTSSRMGEPKPLVLLAGRPLLVHAIDALRKSVVHEIVVVLGAAADRVSRELPLKGTRVVANPSYALGLSTSIRAGLHAADPDAEGFLIVLGDQPLVACATIDTLVAASAGGFARIWIPTYRGVRGNPVLFDRSLSGEIDAIEGDVGCREVVEAHLAEVVEVPVDDPGILIDVDTPEDLRRIESVLNHNGSLEDLAEDRVRAAPRSHRDVDSGSPR